MGTGPDAREIDKEDFSSLSTKGLMAMLEKDYLRASQIFRELIDKYPNEGAAYIHLCEALRRENKLEEAHMDILDKAEELIKSGISKYPMDKFGGLRDLYYLRGVYYAAKGIVDKDNHAKAKAEEQLNKALELDGNFKNAIKAKKYLEEQKSKSGGCFIATAVYGSYWAPEVLCLRAFRDQVLLRSAIGREFVRAYYLISPSIASFILRKGTLIKLARVSIIGPLVRLVRYVMLFR